MKTDLPKVTLTCEETVLVKRSVPQVQLLLRYVSPADLDGLQEIVLTNVATLSRERRRSKTASGTPIEKTRGLYHKAFNGNSAWIEVFVDTMFSLYPPHVLKIPFIRSFALADVLYHEIGHHVHEKLKNSRGNREEFANQFQSKLYTEFIHQHYWYLRPLFAFLRLLNVITKRLINMFMVKPKLL